MQIRALFLESKGTTVTPAVRRVSVSDLPRDGDLLVRVAFSSLNYKDALAVTGKGQIIRGTYPFVPGIDLVGEILKSESPSFQPGDWILGTGGGLGETVWGGYSEIQRLSSRWVVPLPPSMSPLEAMIVGTAGFTAMLAVMTLETAGVEKGDLPILVTGARGGVGSFSVFFLSQAGFTVTASTGSDSPEYLLLLGASDILSRGTLEAGAERAMDSARWAGAVDSVGGSTLAALITQTTRRGSIAVCGLVGGAALETTVYPFILRGIKLFGIDSNTSPIRERTEVWHRISAQMNRTAFPGDVSTIALEEIPARAEAMLQGNARGRTVVRLSE